MKELQERFTDYKITPIGTTRHKNVLRLSKDGHPALVAKTIWHDASEPKGDMGIEAQDKAYRTEVKILKMLPKWWGLHLVDNFKTSLNRVIVTNEVKNIPWSSYKKGANDIVIAERLFKQIQWLHLHNISHNDLELKNILLADSATPLIIDFEKSSLAAKKKQIKNDYTMLLENMKEYPNTESIATILEGISKKRGTRRNRKKRL
jgi:tRNA A-37 threonylcarbamoyl transferase component Bud32